MARRSADMEKEHETNESLKGHKIVQTCHHVQELGIKPTRHNQDDNLVCAECILDFFMAMGRGKDDGKSQEEIILEYIKEFDFPVCFNFPAGHLDDNRTLVFGKECTLEINENGVILKQ